MSHHPSPAARAAAAALLINPNADLRTQIGDTPTCGLCDTQHPADSECPDTEATPSRFVQTLIEQCGALDVAEAKLLFNHLRNMLGEDAQ